MSTVGARVLVAEDDRPLRQAIRRHLRDEGFLVLEADNGLDALSLLRRGGVDIAVIDAVLPKIDGLELVRRVRMESPLPIILMTARGDERARVAALVAGADDYLAGLADGRNNYDLKPSAVVDLAARVHAQLRRTAGFAAGDPVLRTGELELDPSRRRCMLSGEEILLTPREFDLLSALLRRAGRIHSRDQLLELVWGRQDISSKAVDAHVASLRRKLGPAVTIATLRGVGYRLDPVESGGRA